MSVNMNNQQNAFSITLQYESEIKRLREINAALEQKLEVSQREFRAADATIENMQMQNEKLAAENAGLKSEVPMGAIENGRDFADRLEVYPFECQGGNLNMCSDWQELRRCFEHLSEWAMHGQPETPATDAVLAEVRASAIDSLVDVKTKQLADMHPDTHALGATAMSIRSQINELQMFATELRKGVQS